jgi:hypothetical protein
MGGRAFSVFVIDTSVTVARALKLVVDNYKFLFQNSHSCIIFLLLICRCDQILRLQCIVVIA